MLVMVMKLVLMVFRTTLSAKMMLAAALIKNRTGGLLCEFFPAGAKPHLHSSYSGFCHQPRFQNFPAAATGMIWAYSSTLNPKP